MAEENGKGIVKDDGKIWCIGIKNKRGEFSVYSSEKYRMGEFDIINLIKILLVNRRDVSLGKKLLSIFQHATDYAPETYEKLKGIGLTIQEDDKPTKSTKNKYFCY